MLEQSKQPRRIRPEPEVSSACNVVKADFDPALPVMPPVDLSNPESQRQLAGYLKLLQKTRKGSDKSYGECLRAIDVTLSSQHPSARAPILRELQLAVMEALVAVGCSGLAENILIKVAKSSESIHPDLIRELARLSNASAGFNSGRSFAVELSGVESPPHGLFVGAEASAIFSSVGKRFENRVEFDCSEIIRACGRFCSNRLAFLKDPPHVVSKVARADAFAETVEFLLRDVQRLEGLRFGVAVGVLDHHKLLDVAADAVARAATSLWAQIKKTFLAKSSNITRIQHCMREVTAEDLRRELVAAFSRVSAEPR
jgi:hypothetical protein